MSLNQPLRESHLPKLSDEVFESLAIIAKKEFGLHLPPTKKSLVASRLSKRLRILHLESFEDYLSKVSGNEFEEEKSFMLSQLTTNVTHFFREQHHFLYIKNVLVPKFKEKIKNGDRVRIWSAGCSTGQEPYSIAMILKAHWPTCFEENVRILATDIDPSVLEVARKGSYDKSESTQISKFLEPDVAKNFYCQGSEDFQITSDLKSSITFASLNLLREWPMSGIFDLIMCRNVAIYFDAESQCSLWRRFSDKLGFGATLIVGHSERIENYRSLGVQPVDGFPTTFQKKDIMREGII